MKKITKYKWTILSIVVFLISILVIYKNSKIELTQLDQSFQSNYQKEKNYKEFYSECEEIDANVWHTECIIEQLDRAAAIREWKQKKIEALKHPEINIYNLGPLLSDEIIKMREWREDFENSRDKGCIVEWSFRGGSGIPGGIVECELNYEISALKILDDLYYETILGPVLGSEGISDFEPTEENIKNIMKNNKTERGCVWASDPVC